MSLKIRVVSSNWFQVSLVGAWTPNPIDRDAGPCFEDVGAPEFCGRTAYVQFTESYPLLANASGCPKRLEPALHPKS